MTLTQTSQPGFPPLTSLITGKARVSELCACAIVALMTQQVLGSISVVL
ncbi:MAG: hypothetical protein JWM33_2154, partial [Caulobacteraceae bacterium]|nr:hypothetical protein [Caulobacteraceae bacterium]